MLLFEKLMFSPWAGAFIEDLFSFSFVLSTSICKLFSFFFLDPPFDFVFPGFSCLAFVFEPANLFCFIFWPKP